MRVRYVLLGAVPLLILFAAPLAAQATGIPFIPSGTNPIVPTNIGKCAAGWAGLAQLINNLIAFALTILVFFVTPLLIAWAGFLYVVAPSNPANRTRANHILLNTVVGVAIALFAWIIVNALLTALTYLPDPSDPSKAGTTVGGVEGFTQKMFSTTSDVCLVSEDKLSNSTFSQAQGQTYKPTIADTSGGTVTETVITADQACSGHGGVKTTDTDGSGSVICNDDTTQSLIVQSVGSGLAVVPTGEGGVPVDPNIQNGINTLNSQAQATSQGQCAKYVRIALQDAGYTSLATNHPVSAYQYGPYLTNLGFASVSGSSYQAGDVAVFQPVSGHTHGHIAMYNGTQWVSDYKQQTIYASQAYKSGSFTVYRPATGSQPPT